MTADLCIHLLIKGKCSQMWVPGVEVEITPNSLRLVLGPWGFMSYMSCVAAPPCRYSRTTCLAGPEPRPETTLPLGAATTFFARPPIEPAAPVAIN
ncbi:MAG: hypothetical protein CM1200mP2_52180 [Planctomycetaceae bacterium]|nr:MAG: hypothetical protein CM1200mP2_52180 [Planctomycetaceae bacterium]